MAATAVLAGACGDGSDGATGCSSPVREQLDPASLNHVIDPDTATFLTDPPTSGPHVAIPAPTGVLGDPLPPAIQVTVLEAGAALVQYRDQPDPDREALESLTDNGAVVGPNPDLDRPIIATAWTWKLECGDASAESLVALREFVTTKPADAPGADG